MRSGPESAPAMIRLYSSKETTLKIVFCFHTTYNEFHIGIGFLSGAVKILDAETSLVIFREIPDVARDAVEDIAARILENSPDIIAFSIMTFNWRRIKEVIKRVRPAFQGRIIVGGCHAILNPDQVLDFPGVDAVCLGEGEKPLQDLVRFYRRRPLRDTPVIEGMRFKSGNNGNRGGPWRIERLEDFPYIDWDLFSNEGAQSLAEKRIGSFHPTGLYALAAATSRGCPYKCSYCNNHSLMKIYGGPKHYLRKYPVEELISRLKEMVQEQQPEFIEFFDEMFIKDHSWMKTFCERYHKEVGVPFSINTRIDRCKDDMIRMLAESGLKMALFGLECGDEKYRSEYLNRHMSNKAILRGAEILRKYGVLILTFNIFGLPLETRETMGKTVSLNREINPDAVSAFIYQPLPGTPLGSLAFEKNLVMSPPEEQWDYLNPALDSPELPAAVIEEQVARFRAEFNSPERLEACFATLRRNAALHRKGRGEGQKASALGLSETR
ncbi:MAG: B12-binding domain-containing radical SAM protein [Desulfobacterales bacterium]|nr:B12-binding domain-containing radical SAM protein [Desulfobacterales bacterium]